MSVQGFYQETLDMSHAFTEALCLVLEPISVFLIKTGESSSPVQWSSPVNSEFVQCLNNYGINFTFFLLSV